MATTDIRLKRIEKESQSVRGVQDDILDRADTFEEAILGLNGKLNAIMKHLDVPYMPVGFVKGVSGGSFPRPDLQSSLS